MVVERTTRNRGGAARRVGGRAPRGTSKKGKQQEDSSESSEADTNGEDTEDAQGSGTQSNRDALASTGIPGQQPGHSNYTTMVQTQGES